MTAPAPDGARMLLDCQEFYEAAQNYRHAPLTDQAQVVRAYQEMMLVATRLLARPVAAPRAPSEAPVLAISEEEIELLREHAESVVESYEYPQGTPDRKQPTEWHEGRKLWALANRLADYLKARRAALAGAAPAPPEPESTEKRGTFSCPICGVSTPHQHDKKTVTIHQSGQLRCVSPFFSGCGHRKVAHVRQPEAGKSAPEDYVVCHGEHGEGCACRRFYAPAPPAEGPVKFAYAVDARPSVTVEQLAAWIREVDGHHMLGAGELAEALHAHLVPPEAS